MSCSCDETMLCPCCKTALVVKRQMRLQTLDEHICDPNGEPCMKDAFECPNTACPSVPPEIVWDYFGDLYVTGKNLRQYKDVRFIDDNDGPFNSTRRQMNVESKDIESKPLKFAFWPLKGWKVVFVCHRQADYNGNVTKKHYFLRWITPDNCWHTWGPKMLWYCVKKDLRHWYEAKKDPKNSWAIDKLRQSAEQGTWARCEWWRKVHSKFAKFLLTQCKGVDA